MCVSSPSFAILFSMNKQALLKRTTDFVKKKLQHEATGHDWFHMRRVVDMAKNIARREESGNVFIIELAALLHDVADWKVRDEEISEEELLQRIMKQLEFPEEVANDVLPIILNMSYSKQLDGKKSLSKEGEIVQDADRLDALGAIGIARAFAYGGKKGRGLYNPSIHPRQFTSTRAYRSAEGTTINHFYEKLLLLKNLLNTKTAKRIARNREKFMKQFLNEFYQEWEGKK